MNCSPIVGRVIRLIKRRHDATRQGQRRGGKRQTGEAEQGRRHAGIVSAGCGSHNGWQQLLTAVTVGYSSSCFHRAPAVSAPCWPGRISVAAFRRCAMSRSDRAPSDHLARTSAGRRCARRAATRPDRVAAAPSDREPSRSSLPPNPSNPRSRDDRSRADVRDVRVVAPGARAGLATPWPRPDPVGPDPTQAPEARWRRPRARQ